MLPTVSVFHAEPGQTDTTDPDPLPEGFTGQLSLRGPETLGYDETVSTLQRLGILISWAQAQQARVAARLEVLFARDITEASGREEPALAMSLAAAEASTALNIPHMTAMQLISESTRLCTDAPQTLARLAEGKIALQHARIILDETHNLPTDILATAVSAVPVPTRDSTGAGTVVDGQTPTQASNHPSAEEPGQLDLGLDSQGTQSGDQGTCDDAAREPGEEGAEGAVGPPAVAEVLTVRGAFERDLLAAAEGRTAAGFGRRARRLRESRFPDLIPVRHRQAKDQRRVSFQPLPDGMSCLSAIIAAEKGQAMFAALTSAAKAGKHAGDPRTIDQLRTDVLTELLLGGDPAADSPPDAGGFASGKGSPPFSDAEETLSATGTDSSPSIISSPGTGSGRGPYPGSGTHPGHRPHPGKGSSSGDGSGTSTAPGPHADSDSRADAGSRSGSGQESPTEAPAAPRRSPGQEATRPRRAERHRQRSRSKVRTEVMVLINADTLAGLDENPAELNGYGPISAETARAMILDALHWTPLLQDPATGHILTVGRTRRIPAGLKRWLQARDGTCRFPGCSVSVTHAEIDHTKPFSHGGPTDHANLEHLCPKHHRFKTLGHWKARQPEPGTIEWNSPTGRMYATDPALDYQPNPLTRRASNNPAESEDPKHDPPPF
ncbi:HNH endonuclease signature motif containing protein [Arthrobacter koreensis]|uniref:HNH endonuclease signature motif containing protein n=1 Tax=Arthrobacter koreensis TaxID=199136 RepID=UPI003814F88F